MSKPRTPNQLTEEQVQILNNNPYVKQASCLNVRFTEEFKQIFSRKRAEGVSVRRIVEDAGIDPDILGEKRLEGLRYTIKKKNDVHSDFVDKRKNNKRPPEKAPDDSLESRVKYLEHQLAYAQQEVEFLKKLQMADMEARRQWESKHRPK